MQLTVMKGFLPFLLNGQITELKNKIFSQLLSKKDLDEAEKRTKVLTIILTLLLVGADKIAKQGAKKATKTIQKIASIFEGVTVAEILNQFSALLRSFFDVVANKLPSYDAVANNLPSVALTDGQIRMVLGGILLIRKALKSSKSKEEFLEWKRRIRHMESEDGGVRHIHERRRFNTSLRQAR